MRNKQAILGLVIALSVASYVIYATWDAARLQAAAGTAAAAPEAPAASPEAPAAALAAPGAAATASTADTVTKPH